MYFRCKRHINLTKYSEVKKIYPPQTKTSALWNLNWKLPEYQTRCQIWPGTQEHMAINEDLPKQRKNKLKYDHDKLSSWTNFRGPPPSIPFYQFSPGPQHNLLSLVFSKSVTPFPWYRNHSGCHIRTPIKLL